VLQFAHHAAREKESLARYPDLVDLFVATFGDPIADRATRAEERVFVSPFALVTASGFRRGSRIRPDELRRVAMPTLVMWGKREPLGDVSVARAVAELIPQARLEVLAGGHGPWLGQPAQTAAAIADFVRSLFGFPLSEWQRERPGRAFLEAARDPRTCHLSATARRSGCPTARGARSW